MYLSMETGEITYEKKTLKNLTDSRFVL